MTKTAERIAEIAIVALLVFLGIQFLPSRTPTTEISINILAGARVKSMDPVESAYFKKELAQARLVVDGDGDAADILEELKKKYPGRHEVWALSARFLEVEGKNLEALSHYARAVRLNPNYIEEDSPIFLGHRIKSLTNNVLEDLILKKRRSGLSPGESEYLKIAYFLRRRMAGGCE
ncbi:MAG: tetratricopeptide repeat protein [bacterium]